MTGGALTSWVAWPLSIAVRRSLLVWVAPPLVVVEIVNSVARQQEWAIEWQWLGYWSNVATYLTGPLAAGAAAAESIVYRRRSVDGMLGHGWDRVRSQGIRVAAAAAIVVTTHLLGAVACLWAGVRVHHALHPSLQPTIPAFAVCLAWVALGAAVGWIWPSLVAPPLLAITGAALGTITSVGPLQPFVRVGTATAELTGLVTRPAYTLVTCTWWLVLVVVALHLLVRRSGGAQRRDALVGALAILAVGAVLWQGRDPMRGTGRVLSDHCSASRPVLCVTGEYASRLRAYTQVLVPISRALGRLDPAAVPPRLDQAGARVAGSPPIDGVGVISITARGRPRPFDVAWDLVEGASGCPRASTAPSAALANDEARLATWLVRDAGLTAQSVVPPEAEIRSAPVAVQVLSELNREC